MPTYEYACPTCGIVEAFQSMRDAPLKACPVCGRIGIERIMSGGAGVIFKGAGFWETDYNRSKDYQKKAKDDSAAPQPTPQPAPKATPAPAAAPQPTPKT